jgi:CGNR zinc finger protein/putative stress-induced transcription regulator
VRIRVHQRSLARISEQPGGRKPAPGRLEVVQAFVNTNDIEGRRDTVGRPEFMRMWLTEQGLLQPEEAISDTEFLHLLDIREALRGLALANNGLPLDREGFETLNGAAARSLAVQLTPSGQALHVTGEGGDRAVGRLLAAVLDSMREGSWSRMKACRRDLCRWVFYDHSRNRSSSWCAMSICGNRTKTRAYRRRRKETHERER